MARSPAQLRAIFASYARRDMSWMGGQHAEDLNEYRTKVARKLRRARTTIRRARGIGRRDPSALSGALTTIRKHVRLDTHNKLLSAAYEKRRAKAFGGPALSLPRRQRP